MKSANRTLCDILQTRASQQPDQIGYVYLKTGESDELTLTYSELDRQARAVAATLQSRCKPGDRAILLYPPGLEFISAFFGCLYAGVIAVPAYPPRANRNLERLLAIIADSRAAVTLSTDQIARSIQRRTAEGDHLDGIPVIATDILATGCEVDWKRPMVDADTLAFLQYTSGSTGTPKGVMISHGNLVHNSECTRERWEHSSSSVGVSWLPQFHDMGLIVGILQPLYAGFKAVIMSPTAFVQKPYRWLQAISRYRGTTTCAPNFAFDLCVRKITPEQRETLDLSCLETVLNGAEPILSDTLKSFTITFASRGFKASAFRGGYGLAEGTVFVTTSRRAPEGPNVRTLNKNALEQHRVVLAPRPDRNTQEFVGCGPVAGGQELAIVHPELHTRCGGDEVGEIWIRGDSVARGYWQRPDESATTFQAKLEDTKEGPFLRTGDLGFVHGDDLYVTGRIKDLLIVRGRNHYPQDIEKTVEKVHPALRLNSGAAFSLRDEGEERVVVVQELLRDYADVDVDQLITEIFRAVAEEHELPLHTIVLIAEGDISKTSSGKIQRKECKRRFLDGGFNTVRRATFAVSANEPSRNGAAFLKRFHELDAQECHAQVESYLLQMLRATRAGYFHIDVHCSLVRLGLDSIGAADLKAVIERDLGIDLPHVVLMEASVRELAEEIVRQLTTGAFDQRSRPIATAGSVEHMSDADVSSLLEEMLSAREISND